VERDAFYKKLSFDGWGGSSGLCPPPLLPTPAYIAFGSLLAFTHPGHDSVIIAYDGAILLLLLLLLL